MGTNIVIWCLGVNCTDSDSDGELSAATILEQVDADRAGKLFPVLSGECRTIRVQVRS